MRRILSATVFILLSFYVFGQSKLITGQVTDDQGEPLPGVTIMADGTSDGTITDFDGNYSLSTSASSLSFSFIGFQKQVVVIGDRSKINVQLLTDVTALEEVVVIGYGAIKKKDVTSAVVTVDEAAIQNRPMVSAAEALQGKAAGVQVTQPSGKPGSALAVRVRGATSVLAGNEPLYVVDGVPTTDIRGLNPQDIASMTVLKDASSSSIYGARAANGVVLITTKRGSKGDSYIRFNAYYGVSELRKTVETLSTKQYRALMTEMGIALDPTETDYTNWSDKVFGTGTNQSYQLSVGGGSDKSTYMISANYLNQKGMVKPAEFNRYSVRINLDNQVNSWFKIGTSLNVLSSQTQNANDNTGSDRGGIILSVLNTPPFLNVYKNDGSGQFDPNPFQASWENPYANMYGPDQAESDNRIFGNMTATATLMKGLDFKTNFGIDYTAHGWDYYLDPYRTNYGRSQNGLGQSFKSNAATWLWENTLTYTKDLGANHLTVMGGSSIQRYRYDDSYMMGNDFPSDTDVKTINAANNIVTASTNIQEWALASFFARANYDYDGKYLASASVRRDGSSKLAQHWGTMPAFSLGWRLSSESFLKDIAIINDLKIRGGWGRNGNQEGISNYARYGLTSYSRRAATDPLSGPASYQVSYGNPGLKWETTDQTNIGVDLTMWTRISFTADAYIKKTNDVLLDVQLGNSVGDIKSIQTNAGKIENRGIEFNLNTVNISKKNLSWNTDFNISFNRNKVTDLQYTNVYFFGNFDNNFLPVYRVTEGLPLGSMYGYISEGVDPATGDIVYKDVNGNGILDPNDRTQIGTGLPKFIYGITNTLNYKNFDLNLFFQGSYGNDIYNANKIALEGMFDSKNQSVAVLDRWTPENTDTDIPRARRGNFDNVRNSTRFVEDGSYIRLKTATLSYHINSKLLEKVKMQKATVYFTGQNLLTITKYSGFDPEVNAFGQSATEVGIDYGTYPQAKIYTFGLNLEF